MVPKEAQGKRWWAGKDSVPLVDETSYAAVAADVALVLTVGVVLG